MIDAPLAYAFGVGMVATFNPCGFAMLPAYLAYFLGLEETTHPQPRGSVGRALVVGLTVTAGFMLVFGLLGIVLKPALDAIQERLPWITIVLGAVLAIVGVLMVAGKTITLKLPGPRRGAADSELGSVFLFGVSYALVSLSCTIPLFVGVVSTTFDSANLASGVAVFLAYGLGMGLVLMVLTMAIALARAGLVHNMRRIVPYVNRIAGALLIVAGAYVAYYGIYELRLREGNAEGGAIAQLVFDWNANISTWIQDVGSIRLGLLLALVVALAATISLARRANRT